MPLYEFKCRQCSKTYTFIERDHGSVCDCGSELKRVWAVQFPSPNPTFEPHFNHSVGEYVNNWSEFKSALNRKADEQTETLGIEHHYVPLHPADMKEHNEKVMGVTDEGRK